MLLALWSALRILSPRQRLILALLTTARAALGALDLAALVILGVLATTLAQGELGAVGQGFLGWNPSEFLNLDLGYVAIAVAALFVLKTVLATLLLKAVYGYLASIESELSAQAVRSVFDYDLRRAHSFSRGELFHLLLESVHKAISGLLGALSTLVAETALFVAIFALLFMLEPFTAVAAVFYFLGVVLVFQLIVSRRQRKTGRTIADSNVSIGEAVGDLSDSFREILVFGAKDFFIGNYLFPRQEFAKAMANQNFLLAIPRYFIEVSLVTGLTLLLVFQLYYSGPEGLVVASIFLAGGMRIMAALLPMQNAISNIRVCSPQSEAALKALRNSSSHYQMDQVPGAQPSRALSFNLQNSVVIDYSLALENVSFRFPDSAVPLFSNLSLEIKGGSRVGIVGPSGVGKSTLIDLILGVEQPSSGRVLLGGLPPQNAILKAPGSVGFVPQSPAVFRGGVAQNIAIGLSESEIDFDRVAECLSDVGLGEFAASVSERSDQGFGKALAGLSGGQRQRLGLARALYRAPSLLVLDEFTSALDSEAETIVSGALSRISRDVTIVVVSHRLSSLNIADNIYILGEGGIIETGSLEELQSRASFVPEDP